MIPPEEASQGHFPDIPTLMLLTLAHGLPVSIRQTLTHQPSWQPREKP